MTSSEIQTLHERLDRLDDKLDRIMETVTRQVAICGPTRARLDAVCETVYGNGRDGLLRKVERLETVREISKRGFWALVSLISAIVSGTVVAFGGTVLSWLKRL